MSLRETICSFLLQSPYTQMMCTQSPLQVRHRQSRETVFTCSLEFQECVPKGTEICLLKNKLYQGKKKKQNTSVLKLTQRTCKHNFWVCLLKFLGNIIWKKKQKINKKTPISFIQGTLTKHLSFNQHWTRCCQEPTKRTSSFPGCMQTEEDTWRTKSYQQRCNLLNLVNKEAFRLTNA